MSAAISFVYVMNFAFTLGGKQFAMIAAVKRTCTKENTSHLPYPDSDYWTEASGTGFDPYLPLAARVVQFLVMWWRSHDPQPTDTHMCLAVHTCLDLTCSCIEVFRTARVFLYRYVALSRVGIN